MRISNDANAAALAEYSYGSISHNLMVVKIGSGVGSGIVLNGQQYHGESFAAGEIGHIAVEDDGPRCPCGNRGCLETFVSSPPARIRTRWWRPPAGDWASPWPER